MWLGSDGKLYEPGDNVSADVTRLTAQFDEQFTLTIGDTYWFDLSGVGIPGTANSSLPDTSLHYVPFTYAGTVDAYKLTSEMVTTEEYAQKNEYVHSLFVADYVVTHTVGWDNLDGASLIFGKGYAAGSVDYMLRAPSTEVMVQARAIPDAAHPKATNGTGYWTRTMDISKTVVRCFRGGRILRVLCWRTVHVAGTIPPATGATGMLRGPAQSSVSVLSLRS
ncbi:hypothetical protein M5E87_17220 [Flavonifractor plautii]|nr:hypothetical protein M5E87_17220 [Flavonifractor plautii]